MSRAQLVANDLDVPATAWTFCISVLTSKPDSKGFLATEVTLDLWFCACHGRGVPCHRKDFIPDYCLNPPSTQLLRINHDGCKLLHSEQKPQMSCSRSVYCLNHWGVSSLNY